MEFANRESCVIAARIAAHESFVGPHPTDRRVMFAVRKLKSGKHAHA